MRRAAVVLALVTLVFTARSSAQNGAGGNFVTGQILVKFRPGIAASVQADAHRQSRGQQIAEISRTRIQLVSVAAGDERAAIARYQRNPNVLFAEPNFYRRVDTPSVTQVMPGDYYFDQQWALHNTGQLFYCIPWIEGELCFYVGTSDADIDAPEAWEISTGSDVKVAVIDTGIDQTHPDLAGKFAGGYDYVNGDNDPYDDHSHGTHVSGTIAAAINNLTGDPADEEGVVGVAPNARILAYKVCNASGSCSDFAIAQAIAQAVTEGAKVINMSLGGADYSQAMYDAVQDAWLAGLVIVAGAGNDGTTDLFYPAAFDNVVSVGASDEDDLRASFSNYGNWVDIAAPGNVILSTVPMSLCSLGTTPGDLGCYDWKSGTSMATPQVAGAAALVWSRPDVSTNVHVVDLLLNGADRVGVGSVRPDSWTINGRLNLHGAMSYLAPAPNLAPTANAGPDRSATDGDGDGGVMLTLDGSASFDPDGDALTYRWLENGALLGTGPTPSIWFTIGTHTVTLQVTDTRGAVGTDTAVITVDAGVIVPLAVTGLSPSTVHQKIGTLNFTVTGTGFAPGATVGFANGSGPAPRVLSVTYNSANQLTARVEIRAGGGKTVKRWDVVVTNPGGISAVGTGLLTITP
jgi:thermitase